MTGSTQTMVQLPLPGMLERQLTPPLKWAGGKRWLLPHLKPLWAPHSHRRLVEPFCGGLAVTLGLSPTEALLNDINPHLINFYHRLKQGLESTLEMRNDQEVYYRYRENFNQLLVEDRGDSKEAAELFYYLNRTGYNGLCRFNKSGGFNVPFGKHKIISYTYDFSAYREKFTNWNFCLGDFEALNLRDSDFIYADPPYDVEFTQYSKEGFSWNDQVRTAKWLAKHPGPVILSNQATERISALYKELGFVVEFLPAPRMISCTGDREPALEVLAWRNIDNA